MVVTRREGDRISPLVEYIKKNLQKGYKIQDLRWALVSQGHSKIEVDKALKEVNEFLELQKPKKVEEPKVQIISDKMPEFVEEKKPWYKRILG